MVHAHTHQLCDQASLPSLCTPPSHLSHNTFEPWALRGAAHLPPSAQRTPRKGLAQPVMKSHLKLMFRGLAQHHTLCLGARAFVAYSWIVLSQLCKAGVWG